jgi:hypothetical protein
MKLPWEVIAEVDPEILLADGLEDAFIGLSCGHHHKPVACYSYEKALAVFEGQGMSREEAEEWMSFNVLSAYVGEYTPIFIQSPCCEDEPE